MRLLFRVFLAAVAATLFAQAQAQSQAQNQAQAPSPAAPRTVLVIGDSLAAEYGLVRGSGWVPLLARKVAQQYPNYRVINASISGDTTSGGVTRLPALLQQHRPAVVVIELGSNDALRGLALDMTEKNLHAMVQAAGKSGAKVLLVGMRIPPNYGREYTERFMQVYANVAQTESAPLVPFLMDGIATDRSLFQADGIHPNEAAQPRLLENVWPKLAPLL